MINIGFKPVALRAAKPLPLPKPRTHPEWRLEIGEFKPCEQHFPDWAAARTILEHCFPERLRFWGDLADADARNSLSLDFRWALKAMAMAPDEQHRRIQNLANHFSRIMVRTGLLDELREVFVSGRTLVRNDQMAWAHAEALLARRDDELKSRGEPTSMQALRHIFGLTAWPVDLQHIKIGASTT